MSLSAKFNICFSVCSNWLIFIFITGHIFLLFMPIIFEYMPDIVTLTSWVLDISVFLLILSIFFFWDAFKLFKKS